jgi:hypothetical protein
MIRLFGLRGSPVKKVGILRLELAYRAEPCIFAGFFVNGPLRTH